MIPNLINELILMVLLILFFSYKFTGEEERK